MILTFIILNFLTFLILNKFMNPWKMVSYNFSKYSQGLHMKFDVKNVTIFREIIRNHFSGSLNIIKTRKVKKVKIIKVKIIKRLIKCLNVGEDGLFYLSGFCFTTIHESQGCRESWRAFL